MMQTCRSGNILKLSGARTLEILHPTPFTSFRLWLLGQGYLRAYQYINNTTSPPGSKCECINASHAF
ncbi:hypothetical protein M404DRAFT_1003430 [Pisolithus tinctorius Marx 270]|uniref:Uncharacterized protein n=1 Tax=Pisolithus tinctorius Marx 270 TaxID=870435 RepID=A0A0C3IWE7_PISTI|nr:hypothetical protein M404DRAFT_1003430 [Pisolithus tinctorius Marx 270]